MWTELVLQTWSNPYIPNMDEIYELKSGIIEGDTEYYWKFISDSPSIIHDSCQSTLFYLLLCGTPACMVWVTGALAYMMAETIDGLRAQVGDEIFEFCSMTIRSLTEWPCTRLETLSSLQVTSATSNLKLSDSAEFTGRFKYVTREQKQLFSSLLSMISGYTDNDDDKAIIIKAYNVFWNEFGDESPV